jgi:hypothetical protein
MTKPLSFLSAVLVAAAIAVPTVAAAQGSRRGGGDSGSSGGSRSGSGGGSVAVPRDSSPAPAPRAESPSPSGESGPAVRSEGPRSTSAGSSQATGRARGNQAVRGYAQPRTYTPGGGSHNVIVWPSWYYPYYGAYFGYSNYPYYGYWNRYGWYDPFLFDPFGYGYYGAVPYYYPPSVSYSTDYETRERPSTGAIRFKVNPKDAKVYIDGALAGTVDEFDGLSDHLELAPGAHQLELRADGFKTYTGTLEVKEGQTRTTRVSLDRQ